MISGSSAIVGTTKTFRNYIYLIKKDIIPNSPI